jgi:cyclophilin family peptidyl-prolyl cis-trans isomerase
MTGGDPRRARSIRCVRDAHSGREERCRARAAAARFAVASLGLASLVVVSAVLAGCGVAERPHAAQDSGSPSDDYSWPTQDYHVAVLELADRGEIQFALYPQLAPKNVESFARRAEAGYYDGVTFHRVIKDFMIQGGDPYSRDDDPANDGRGGADETTFDEFSDAPFVRGVVGVANEGRPDSGGSQFFIMHKDQRGLDGHYTVLGRVIAGLHLVDDVAHTETDIGARWGPVHRPIEDIVIDSVRIERASDRAAKASAVASASGQNEQSKVKQTTIVADTNP